MADCSALVGSRQAASPSDFILLPEIIKKRGGSGGGSDRQVDGSVFCLNLSIYIVVHLSSSFECCITPNVHATAFMPAFWCGPARMR